MRVNTEGPSGAKIMFVGEAPGEVEDHCGKPFRGTAGKTFDWLLPQAGINRFECLVGNVARMQPPGNKISYFFVDKKCTIPKPEMLGYMSDLKADIELYRPNIIVALGVTALWALTGEKRISEFSGYIMPCTLAPGFKVLPTYHPQAINYDWKLHFQTVLDLRKAKRHSEFPEIPEDTRTFEYDVSLKRFIEFLRYVKSDVDRISVDIEAANPGSHVSHIGIAPSGDFGISFTLLKNKYPTIPERDEITLWSELADVLEAKKIIMQNTTYDKGVFWLQNHILCRNVTIDTLLQGHCCWPELPRDLGFLASKCLDIPAWKHLSDVNKGLYNAMDATATYAISEVLDREIDRAKHRSTFELEMSEIDVATMLQLRGVLINEEARKRIADGAKKIEDETGTALKTILKRTINFNSPKQLQQLLYVDLGLPVQYKRRKKATDPKTITADAKAIKKLQIMFPDNPIFRLVLEHKKYWKLGQFVNTEISPDSRVHTSYNITGSSVDEEGKKSFGRWSSSSSIILPYGTGNLQNIPQAAREMYYPDEGFVMLEADYVQAEAVVVAYLSGDQNLINMFKRSFGKPKSQRDDVHKITAATMYEVVLAEVSKEMRRVGKALRHASNYCAGPEVVATSVGCSIATAKKLLQKYYDVNPLLRLWHQSIQKELQKSRVLTNLLGRKHRFLGRYDDSLFRSAYSYKPQSTVGDLLNMSMVKAYNDEEIRERQATILLQLHDAIYFQTPIEQVEWLKAKLREIMIVPIEVNHDIMTIDVDFKVGESWGSMLEEEE